MEVAPRYEAGSAFLAFIRKQVGAVHGQNTNKKQEPDRNKNRENRGNKNKIGKIRKIGKIGKNKTKPKSMEANKKRLE